MLGLNPTMPWNFMTQPRSVVLKLFKVATPFRHAKILATPLPFSRILGSNYSHDRKQYCPPPHTHTLLRPTKYKLKGQVKVRYMYKTPY